MNAQKRREIFARLASANPAPSTELTYGSPFELLIAVILSAQSTDKGVNLATRKLFAVADTPRKMLELGVTGIERHIKSLGLYHSKAKHIIETCDILLTELGEEVPGSRTALEKLPGVGRKTANVVLNIAFGHATVAVDTHIFRVANRTGIAPGKSVLEVEKKLLKYIPGAFLRHAHHWLILHGRYVCRARRPLCPECLISDLCEYKGKTSSSA